MDRPALSCRNIAAFKKFYKFANVSLSIFKFSQKQFWFKIYQFYSLLLYLSFFGFWAVKQTGFCEIQSPYYASVRTGILAVHSALLTADVGWR